MKHVKKFSQSSLLTAEQAAEFDRQQVRTSFSDFLKNPDLFRDEMPQPYRRINKVLEEILEKTWSNIEQKYSKKQNKINQTLSQKPATEFVINVLA